MSEKTDNTNSQATSLEELHETLRKEFEIVVNKKHHEAALHGERPSASLPMHRSEEWFEGIPESSMECFSAPKQSVKSDSHK